jgi:hypothetical protein
LPALLANRLPMQELSGIARPRGKSCTPAVVRIDSICVLRFMSH